MTDKQFEIIWDKTCVMFCIVGIFMILFVLTKNILGVIISMFMFFTMVAVYLIAKFYPDKKEVKLEFKVK